MVRSWHRRRVTGLLVLGWRLCLPKTGRTPQNSIFIGISVIRKAKTTVWVWNWKVLSHRFLIHLLIWIPVILVWTRNSWRWEKRLSWDVRSCVIPKACSILRICRGLLCNVAVRHARRSCWWDVWQNNMAIVMEGNAWRLPIRGNSGFSRLRVQVRKIWGLYGLPGAYRTTMWRFRLIHLVFPMSISGTRIIICIVKDWRRKHGS